MLMNSGSRLQNLQNQERDGRLMQETVRMVQPVLQVMIFVFAVLGLVGHSRPTSDLKIALVLLHPLGQLAPSA
jgi:hypothetical protein